MEQMPIPKPRRGRRTDNNNEKGPPLPPRLYRLYMDVPHTDLKLPVSSTETNQSSKRDFLGKVSNKSEDYDYDYAFCCNFPIYAEMTELYTPETPTGQNNTPIYEQLDDPTKETNRTSRETDFKPQSDVESDYDYDYPDINRLSRLAKAYEKWLLSTCPKCQQKSRNYQTGKLNSNSFVHREAKNGARSKCNANRKSSTKNESNGCSHRKYSCNLGYHVPCSCRENPIDSNQVCSGNYVQCLHCNRSCGSHISCSCSQGHYVSCSCGNSSCGSYNSCSSNYASCSCGNSSCGSHNSCSSRFVQCSCANSSCGSHNSCSPNCVSCSCANSSCGSHNCCSCNSSHFVQCSCANSFCSCENYATCSCGNSSCCSLISFWSGSAHPAACSCGSCSDESNQTFS
ncbi:protein KPLCE-like [Ylistrum balloti]|uniref:protein KPLCE-like n=1 Tax=Ylistrum balloti TaxID=509963 RepID=UPI002905AE2D|nr:protein KPLCE-like [Ylistrum balloti]